MKSVLLSKQPQIVANVLNEKAKILVCKRFPKDYVGWVYIHCNMGKPYLCHEKTNLYGDDIYELTNDSTSDLPNRKHAYTVGNELNGKVVARFWCDKVEEIKGDLTTDTLFEEELLKRSCIGWHDLEQYLNSKKSYAIHISRLEIFDRPRELKQIRVVKTNKVPHIEIMKPLTKAPQNYCYIEGEE